jgi:diguanylate cyclase (GGDEF)-like protein
MEPLSRQVADPGAIDLHRVERACAAALALVDVAKTPLDAIDGALRALHDELGGPGVAAFVLEHGRLWSVGVRGYAMIPDGLSLDEGVIGRAVRSSAAQLVVDVTEDPDFVEVSRATVSELSVPLVMPTGVVGVLNIETSEQLPEGSVDAIAALVAALAVPIDELRGSRADLSSLARLFVYMSSLRDPRAIAEVTARSLGRVLPVETSQLLLLDEEGQLVESTEWSATPQAPEPLALDSLRALRERIDASAVVELLDTNAVTVPELAGLKLRSVVLIPLRANGEEVGLLVGASRFAREFDRGQGELAALLAAHAAVSLDAAVALDRERRSAHTDPLTGLYNRRGLEDLLERALGAAQEERSELSLVVLDCDDFKDVNDRAGHEFGDALLREVGLVLSRTCPEGAQAARLGGDEFVIMLPGADADAAFEATDRLRRELGDGLSEAGFPLRLSAGVSTYPYDGAAGTQLLRAADQALYHAKARGKNQVVCFREILRGASSVEPTVARSDRSRSGSSGDASALVGAMDAAVSIWAEESLDDVLERLGKAIAFVIGATATNISKVEGPRLADLTKHALRDVDLGGDNTYLIADYPVTRHVLETATVRSISFLDDEVDSGEAFVLRELQMNAAMLVPLVVHDRSWGLVEIYDMRLRRFTSEDEALAWFLVGQAGRRIEVLGESSGSKRRLRFPSRLP